MNTNFIYEKKQVVLNHHNDHIGRCISRANNFYESGLLGHIRKNCRGGLFIDVGANIGNHTCFFSLFCADRVIAIEPVEENFNLLLKNIEDNNLKNVEAINNAISLKPQKLNTEIVADNMGMCNMVKSKKGKTSITPQNLDTDNLRLLKIDCEKMSMEVFEAFLPIIIEKKCDLIIEANEVELAEITKKTQFKVVGKFNATPTYHLKP